METVHIYLAGGMSGLPLEEQCRWRNQIQNAIKYGEYELQKNIEFFSPPDYYSPLTADYKSEREVMDFDLNHLRKSDLLIVNFNSPKSLGTAMELMLAKEHNIPVIGLNKDGAELHPWIVECCNRICDSMRELVSYVTKYYL